MHARRPVDLRRISAHKRRKPQTVRTGLFAAVTVAAGALCGYAALFGIGPFNALHASANYAGIRQPTASRVAPIEARILFPAVSPVTKVVNVNDPPPGPRPPEMAPKPEHVSSTEHEKSVAHVSSSARVRATPSPSPVPGDE